jgi:L-lactate dehydrogenase complex protein LldG
MKSRDDILARVRKNQPAARPLPEVPVYDAGRPASLATFTASLVRMGGKVVEPPADGDLDALLARLFPSAKVVCSAAPEVRGNRPIGDVRAPRELADVDVGVVRAVFGVAETGSVWLSETEYGIEALGFLSQHLVVLLDPSAIVTNLHRAYRHRGFFEARYAVLMTGPSATADIEGVLIHGAQGIRTMTIIPMAARRAGQPALPGVSATTD